MFKWTSDIQCFINLPVHVPSSSQCYLRNSFVVISTNSLYHNEKWIIVPKNLIDAAEFAIKIMGTKIQTHFSPFEYHKDHNTNWTFPIYLATMKLTMHSLFIVFIVCWVYVHLLCSEVWPVGFTKPPPTRFFCACIHILIRKRDRKRQSRRETHTQIENEHTKSHNTNCKQTFQKSGKGL